ncbi:30S ribosome-binding factor RbfA [Tropicibacter oceani]|uniref:Ribosome-binding factor A n=1 Tax=Tropicibacter oceani TaxID=3058420 RepID=A0ABY8QHB8_9RHOB|nr:30S ribosome-binding factor RbfA [Tropicibacter oceani]WGW04042.1 30S ribosome-binding factor RbfA [Tropicibacter oceani]
MANNRIPDGPGQSQRQLRVGELLRRRLSEILSRAEIHDPDLNRMVITVGEVRVSPDLRIATAYVVPLGGKGQDEMFELLHKHRGELRHLLSKGLKIKHTPQLHFRLDDTFDQLDEHRRLFSQDAVRRDLDK